MKGIGIDLCGEARIARAMEQTPAFLERYYTPEERAYIAARGKMGAQSAAAMYAAKEAFLKAVGTGIGAGVALSDIEVRHLDSGAPRYALRGAALQRMQALGAASALLSLTHENGMAAAVCVIE